MGTMQFTYNGETHQIINKHNFKVEDFRLTFGCDFIVTGATDAAFNTACNTAADALSQDFQAFTLTIGGESRLTWSHAINTGFLTRASCIKIGSVPDTARSAIFRFELTAEREPRNTARLGRRQATISLSLPNPDLIRTVTFEGTWTALESGPAAAKATYDTNVQAWIDSWIDTGIIQTGGTKWQRVAEPQIAWDDEDKVLRFRVVYRDVQFSSSPTNLTDGVFTVGTFTRADPPELGQGILNTPSFGGTTATTAERGGPKRFNVQTLTFLNDFGTTNSNTFWNDVIRPWIDATITAMFTGITRVIFESHTEPIEDVAAKRIQCNAVILVAGSNTIIAYDEIVRRVNDRRLLAENIWNGKPDNYDLNEGGRRLEIVHTIIQERVDSIAQDPPFIGAPWQFLFEDFPQQKSIIDPITQQIKKYKTTHTRRYLYVVSTGGGGGGGGVGLTAVRSANGPLDP